MNRLLLIAENMRTKPTDAERILWRLLWGKRFCGYKFKRQVVINSYIVDFLAATEKVVIEIDGGQHSDEEHTKSDRIRTAYLEKQGYKVIRFWNNQVLNDRFAVLEDIYNTLNPPLPRSLSPKGARGEERI